MTKGSPTEPKSRLRRAYVGLVIEVFRLNGDQLAIGNALGADLGLTSARWQVLGAISLSPVPLPVAHIARNMGWPVRPCSIRWTRCGRTASSASNPTRTIGAPCSWR